ncbi:hypothetical protein [Sphingobacterium sp. DR205]|uniref:hypothetical protein n=1 Tax=Sphingobacterium sp. DR205 TaxID=2713573 RepID=UPI0013E51BAF|nr:hypothetical protein [Sphingobacterium sp. DR205]QIH35486.1 hypothetical protein G6053_22560 [Sphingobacterium sp. DR205]
MKEKRMHIIVSLLSCWLIAACAIFRGQKQLEKNSSTRASQYENRNLLFHYKQQDSLFTYWYFRTDSLLSFRPDSGLKARGGQLYVQQSRSSSAEQKLAADQQHTRATETLDSVTRRERWVLSLDALRIASVVFLVLLYLMWRVWKKKRFES